MSVVDFVLAVIALALVAHALWLLRGIQRQVATISTLCARMLERTRPEERADILSRLPESDLQSVLDVRDQKQGNER